MRPEVLPATYVMLVDSSQSIAHGVGFLRDAVTRFMRYLRPDDRVLVVPFSRTLGADDRADQRRRDRARRAARGPARRRHRDLRRASSPRREMIRRREGRHVLVLLSDGYDEHSVATRDDAVRAVQTSGATAYVIGVGGVAGISMKGEALLKSFAEATGGRAFFPYRESELPVVHDRVASDVATRYVLTYTPTNQRVDGSLRAIRLVTADAGAGRAHQAGLLRAEAAAGAADARADRGRREPARPRRDARGPGRRRGRRAADRRGLLRGHQPGVDRPGARRERQHAAGGRGREGGGAVVRRRPAQGGSPGGAALLRQGGARARPDAVPLRRDEGDRRVHVARRHRAVGRRARVARPAADRRRGVAWSW